MAKKSGSSANKKVKRALKERKEGTLRSGKSGKKVTSRKQAIAIGLAEARRRGAKVAKKSTSKTAKSVKSAKRTAKKTATKAVKKAARFKSSTMNDLARLFGAKR